MSSNIILTFSTQIHSATAVWYGVSYGVFVVADYVFFENSSSNPYLIRRIEELNKVLLCFCVISLHVFT